MGIEKIHIEQFLQLADSFPVLDVRSPAEFAHAHIPGAFSLPLFTDEERKVVGTAYKQQSREAAIKEGLTFFGPNMRSMVEQVEQLMARRQPPGSNKQDAPPSSHSPVLVHCWRGGMRSAGVAWLLDLYGFKVYTLTGGYKAFRNWAIKQFSFPHRFNILGGYTGSGKTELLESLRRRQQPVIDLEALAGHKGSAFGNIGLPPQPSQEMFENKLALHLHACSSTQGPHRIWLEDESQRIGTVNIPQPLWLTMRRAPVYFLNIPFEQRLEHITEEYGTLDRERVSNAIGRLQKRLGGLEAKTALAHLREDNVRECFRILLKYYDKYYLKGLNNREQLNDLLTEIPREHVHTADNADAILRSTQTVTAS